MTEHRDQAPEEPLLHLLEPDEKVHIQTRSIDATLAITDRRLVVATGQRVALDIPYESLRRIQFDIERDRPATLVLVPDRPTDQPQVLAIPPEEYERTCMALAEIGRRLAEA